MNIELQNRKISEQDENGISLIDDEQQEEYLNEVNEEAEQQYISRQQLIKNLKFPRSSDKRVIVLPNNEGYGFRYDCYDPQILGNYLTEKEFRNSIYELTKICSLQYANKLKREKQDPFHFEKRMLLWNIPLLIIAILLFSLRVFNVVQNNYTFEIGVALFGVGILLILVNFIKSQTKKPDLTSFQEITYTELTKKIVEFNKFYIPKGIKWHLHPKFYWVEIEIF